MGKLRNLQKRSNLLARNWAKIRSKALDKTKDIALDIITDDQLFALGIDGTGGKLPLPYAAFTIDIKKSKGQPTDRITLYDEGNFHRGIFGKVSGDNILTDSKDSKSVELHKEWGVEILSMTKENTAKYAKDAVLPELQDLTRKALGL